MMQPLKIDFVRARRPASWLAVTVLIVAAAAMAAVLVDLRDARDELAQAQTRLERVQERHRQAQALQRSVGPVAPAGTEAPAIRNIVARLGMPWDRMLRELEGQADDAVALLSVESQGQARRLRVTGEARSIDHVLAYVGRLGAIPGIGAATLAGHEERQAGATRVIRFSLDVNWKSEP